VPDNYETTDPSETTTNFAYPKPPTAEGLFAQRAALVTGIAEVAAALNGVDGSLLPPTQKKVVKRALASALLARTRAYDATLKFLGDERPGETAADKVVALLKANPTVPPEALVALLPAQEPYLSPPKDPNEVDL
jgi:hypothetical protein